MYLRENPVTVKLHDYWRTKIFNVFKDIYQTPDQVNLSILQYVDSSPQKYYDRESFKLYFSFLSEALIDNPGQLVEVLRTSSNELNIASRFLTEVNKKNIHECYFPEKEFDLYKFLDKEIHYEYLKVLESPFYQTILILAKIERFKRGAKYDGLKLYNCVQELENSKVGFIKDLYSNVIRNSIAHGKFVFKDFEIEYIDSNNKEILTGREFIKLFDKLLDNANAFMLALKLFYFTKKDLLTRYDITVPQSFLTEELQSNVKTPGWEFLDILEHMSSNSSKPQLNIYIKNDCWSLIKVLQNALRTAVLAETYSNGYERFFIEINSTHSGLGYAIFDGNKLKKLREENNNNTTDYLEALEDKRFKFVPKYKFPNFFYSIATLRDILKINYPLSIREAKKKAFPKRFDWLEVVLHGHRSFTLRAVPAFSNLRLLDHIWLC